MTAPVSNRFDSVSSAGASTGLAGLVPVVTIRPPASTDIRGPYGPFRPSQIWVDSVGLDFYGLASLSSSNGIVSATWVGLGGDAGGVLSVAGTANQITAANASGAVTLSIPSAFIAPGSIAATTSITAGTTITATLGAITATNGNLVLGTTGNKLLIATGPNASIGTATLSGGSVVVASSAVTASSIILLTRNTPGGTPGQLSTPSASILPGTSFFIDSTEASETSTVNWLIIN